MTLPAKCRTDLLFLSPVQQLLFTAHRQACPNKYTEEHLHDQTWVGLPHLQRFASVLPRLPRSEHSLELPVSPTLGTGMSVGYSCGNGSAVRCLAPVMWTREKCLCQLMHYECTGAQACCPKLSFLFAIEKMLQGQGTGTCLGKV